MEKEFNIDYQIIPLVGLEPEINRVINNILDTNQAYVMGLKCISNLLSLEDDAFPIKKKLAIKNILDFTRALDYYSIMNKNESVVPISSTVFVKHFNRNHYSKYLFLLAYIGMIKRVEKTVILAGGREVKYYYNNRADDKYGIKEIKSESCSYRISDDYFVSPVLVISNDMHGSLKDEVSKKINISNKMKNTIRNVEINWVGAITDEIAEKKPPLVLKTRLNVVLSLTGNRYIKSGVKSNRIYHSLSQLSKVSRKHLHVNGEKFNNIDIVNCQPLLLCAYLKSKNLKVDALYQKICQSGDLYELFYNKYDKYDKNLDIVKNKEITEKQNRLRRDEAKTELYKCVFFDFKKNSTISLKFKKLFPETYESLVIAIKDLDKNELKMAGALQTIESNIFNSIVPRLSRYYFTLFDAVYFTNILDIVMIMRKIKDEFTKYDLVPKITVNEQRDDEISEFEIREVLGLNTNN